MNLNPSFNPTSIWLLRILRYFGGPQQPLSCGKYSKFRVCHGRGRGFEPRQ